LHGAIISRPREQAPLPERLARGRGRASRATCRFKEREPGSLVTWTAGKVMLVSAVVLAIVGLGALGLAKLGVDRVPGTLSWKSDNVTVFVPIGLMLLVSIGGTIVLNVFMRR
jgi:Protein of unknown function (DUF2905)